MLNVLKSQVDSAMKADARFSRLKKWSVAKCPVYEEDKPWLVKTAAQSMLRVRVLHRSLVREEMEQRTRVDLCISEHFSVSSRIRPLGTAAGEPRTLEKEASVRPLNRLALNHQPAIP